MKSAPGDHWQGILVFAHALTNSMAPARFPAESGRDADAADGFLKDRGIIVRRMEAYGLGDCLRITIGQEDEMRALVDTLAAFRE